MEREGKGVRGLEWGAKEKKIAQGKQSLLTSDFMCVCV